MKKRIDRLIEGLNILKEYSNDVYTDGYQVIAGPVLETHVPEADQKRLDDMDWFFEENSGWAFYIGNRR